MKFYITEETKQELENKIKTLEKTKHETDFTIEWNEAVVMINLLKDILSSATILPDTFSLLPELKPVKYINTPEFKKTIEYGRYLVVRKDGKKHLEIFNGTGWAYNNDSIIAFYLPKID